MTWTSRELLRGKRGGDAGVEVEKGSTSLLLKVNATAQIPGLMCSGQQGYPGPDGRWTGKPGGGGADWYCQADSVRYAQGQSLCAVYDSGRGGRGDVPLAPFQTLPVMKACPTAKPPPPSLKADDGGLVRGSMTHTYAENELQNPKSKSNDDWTLGIIQTS